MRSMRSLLGVGRRALATRLDHLQNTLTNLGERLRVIVADAVGRNLGSVVSETFAEALSPTDSNPSQFFHDEEPNALVEEDPFTGPQLDEEPTDHLRDDDISEESVATSQTSNRLPIALAAGLKTAAWWVRRCWNGWAIAGALSIGVVVGCIAFFKPPLADAGLRLAESSDQITLLSQAAKAGAQVMLK